MTMCSFVLQFLKVLQEEDLLVDSLACDLARIESETVISNNVVEIVAGNIGRLPDMLQTVLKIAACFWSSFDAEILTSLLGEAAIGEE
jgi:predicted ATPase